jgi:hypothetical protein
MDERGKPSLFAEIAGKTTAVGQSLYTKNASDIRALGLVALFIRIE